MALLFPDFDLQMEVLQFICTFLGQQERPQVASLTKHLTTEAHDLFEGLKRANFEADATALLLTMNAAAPNPT
jgi:hypothetical protein